MKKSLTKDEQFLICLYEEASKLGDLFAPFDRYFIGQKAGLQERGVNAISILLIRANFIKKHGEIEVFFTPHGLKLVQLLFNSDSQRI